MLFSPSPSPKRSAGPELDESARLANSVLPQDDLPKRVVRMKAETAVRASVISAVPAGGPALSRASCLLGSSLQYDMPSAAHLRSTSPHCTVRRGRVSSCTGPNWRIRIGTQQYVSPICNATCLTTLMAFAIEPAWTIITPQAAPCGRSCGRSCGRPS